MYRNTKKIPTIIGLLLLIIGVGGGIYLVEQRTSGSTKASTEAKPMSVQVTNITDSSFSVVWLTKEPATGWVIYGNSQKVIDQVVFDDRDSDNKPKTYLTHQTTIRNLQPKTNYYFTITSGDKKFQNESRPYSLLTAEKTESPSLLEPSYGQVLTSQNEPAEGALVILNMPKAMPLSALVKPSGNWLIPLNIARDLELKPFIYSVDGQTAIPISLMIYSSTEDKAEVTTDSKNDSPVPPITLGKTYNFEGLQGKKKENTQIAQVESTKTPEKQVLGQAISQKFEVLSPEEGTTFVSQKPLFRGTGISAKDVFIEITTANNLKGQTKVSANNLWSWTPPSNLPPKNHTVKISSTDESGKNLIIQRNFIVFKSGTQVLGEATPSGTITATPTKTPTPTLAIGQASPSATIRPIATVIPTITKIPVSGNVSATIYLLAGGLSLIFIGLKCLDQKLF